MTNELNSDQQVNVNEWNNDEFAKRLKLAIKNVTPYAFAKKCGFGESVMRGYLSGSTTPGAEKLLIMATVANVSLDWLVTGNNQPPATYSRKNLKLGLFEDPAEEHQLNEGDMDIYSTPPAEWSEFTKIPLYNIEASAGHGSALEDEEIRGGIAFRTDWLHAKGLKEHHLATITARGDSMEAIIKNGDILLVNLLDTNVGEDAIYVIRRDGHLFAKRLQLMFNGELYIKSDNQAYTTQIVIPDKTTDLTIVGRVVWIGHEI